ncbi:MAG: hypothetical protein LCH78_21190, partial [Proteobacteria bacterium]|nr:hypothetical protein [Pseudomonadota bacterium]
GHEQKVVEGGERELESRQVYDSGVHRHVKSPEDAAELSQCYNIRNYVFMLKADFQGVALGARSSSRG